MTVSDHARLMEAVARHFFGEPNRRLSKRGELRFGSNGSKSIDLQKGVYFDHENNQGGDALDLIMRELSIGERHEAYGWAERQGYWINGHATNGSVCGSREVAAYDYTDEAGALLYQAVRLEPKDFRQRRPDGRGGWIWNVKGVRQVPYRLPELLEALGNERMVWIVEGEKDVDRLWSVGLPATCNVGGAKKWKAQLNNFFKDAHIIIVADNDDAGQNHARDVAGQLTGVASRISVLYIGDLWPECPPKGDLSDYFDCGGTIENLNAFVLTPPRWAPQHAEQTKGHAKLMVATMLETMTFDPIKTIIPGILVEGLTLLAGKPKGGKSWLLLHAAIAVATNGFTLGDLHCMQGDVLYCALEDSLRRLQSRVRKLGIGFPERLTFCTELPRLAAGGLEEIIAWLDQHPQARLVIIDTLAMVRGERKREQTTYDADYEAVLALRKVANDRKIAIVVVHHLRKADADDAFHTVSGTLGLTGAPDSILILRRDSQGTYALAGKGRDLIDFEKAMTFDRQACLWRIAGEAADVKRSSERSAILAAIEEAGEPIGPNDIASAAGMKSANVRKLLPKLVKEGVIEKVERRRYQPKKAL